MYDICENNRRVRFDPETWDFSLEINGERWEIIRKPYLRLASGKEVFLADGKCEHKVHATGVLNGVEAVYTFDESITKCRVITHMALEKLDGRLHFDVRVENDGLNEIEELHYPGAFSLNAEKGRGCTVYPVSNGALIPAKDSNPIDHGGRVYGRSLYMPFFGQIRNGTGYLAIYETPYDARHHLSHEAEGDTIAEPSFIESLGTIRYKREMIYDFFEKCDYVSICKSYRQYVKEKGLFVSLDEKAVKNPHLKNLYGIPVLRKNIKVQVTACSKHYNAEDPSKNISCKTFDELAEELRGIKAKGVEHAHILLSGWPTDGFDHKHPEPLPIDPAMGGEEGFRRLQETCTELGYFFSIHDQYRDYYYDSEHFSFDNATLEPDGSYPFCNIWDGGEHTMLCAKLAPQYLRKNYQTLRKMGIHFDGYYLDVFSVVELDECCCPDHLMTREECVQYRNETLHYLAANGSVPSSEEVIDCSLPSIAMANHSRYLVAPNPEKPSKLSNPIGIPVPLFPLVYHDCVVVPWMSVDKPNENVFGIPAGESFLVHAALNGATVIMQNDLDHFDDLDHYDHVQDVLALHKRIANQEMVNHEFLDGSFRKQRTTFADGTMVEADMDKNTYRIIYPD